MAEYSRLAKGNFTATGTSAVVVLPFQPDYVELWNISNDIAAGTHEVVHAWWDNKVNYTGNGTIGVNGVVYNPTIIELYSGSSTSLVYDSILTNGISTFSAGLGQQFGATQQIIGITKASQAVVNVTAHGYNVGDTVIMQGIANSVTNNAFRLLNGIPFTIVAVSDANHFTINWNTNQSNYTAISGSPTGALVKKVLYPFLYLPEDNVISAITLGSTTTVATTMYHNFEIGQEIAFRIPTLFGTTQLNSLPNNVIPGSPIYGYVTSITDNWTFVVNINSSAFTAFNTNPSTVPASFTFPQVLAVGDVNTGGNSITATSPLYPSPQFPTSTNRVPTINGPAIRGAFVNNTAQGFIIGPGIAAVDGTATLIANTNIVYWHAYLHDYSNP